MIIVFPTNCLAIKATLIITPRLTAYRRNEFVATLATEITVLYTTPGGRLERLLQQLQPQAGRIARLADLSP